VKILWHSNAPFAPTGYGNQTALFAPRIQKLGHGIAISCLYGLEGGTLQTEDGIRLLPRYCHPYGVDIAGEHAERMGADVILTLIDAWVMEPERWKKPWVAWAPVDMLEIPDPVLKRLRQAAFKIAYSMDGFNKMKAAGLNPLYVPHGVDCKQYAPMSKREARDKLEWPHDRFIVGMVAANKGYPARKAWPEQLRAFEIFKGRHPEALLYLHTNLGGDHGGVDLPKLFEAHNLKPQEEVAWSDPYGMVIGFPPEHMRLMYSAFDVFLNVAHGEGFGIPAVEAQACGTPVIVGNWTAMPELCFGGWTVKEGSRLWAQINGYVMSPEPEAIAAALDEAFAERESEDRARAAREGALRYDADLVTEQYWKPALETIDRNLKETPGPVMIAEGYPAKAA